MAQGLPFSDSLCSTFLGIRLLTDSAAGVPHCSACESKSLTPWRQDRLVEEAGAEAILCLQSGLCHEALQIDWPAIRERALERGVVITRVAVRDFDHNDQVHPDPHLNCKIREA